MYCCAVISHWRAFEKRKVTWMAALAALDEADAVAEKMGLAAVKVWIVPSERRSGWRAEIRKRL